MRIKNRELDNKIYEVFSNLSLEKWKEFNNFVTKKIEEVREEAHNLKERYRNFSNIFSEEILIEVETEMIAYLKNNMRNRKSQIVNFMIERFN